MGILLSCDQKKESIINLSDNCVSRITKEDVKCAKKKPYKEEDGEWIAKLKCLDDIHTQENGITLQCVLDLIQKIQTQIQDDAPPNCDPTVLKKCLKHHETCMIKCKQQMDDFIDCVDAKRVDIIREKYEEAKRQEAEQEQKRIKELLKGSC